MKFGGLNEATEQNLNGAHEEKSAPLPLYLPPDSGLHVASPSARARMLAQEAAAKAQEAVTAADKARFAANDADWQAREAEGASAYAIAASDAASSFDHMDALARSVNRYLGHAMLPPHGGTPNELRSSWDIAQRCSLMDTTLSSLGTKLKALMELLGRSSHFTSHSAHEALGKAADKVERTLDTLQAHNGAMHALANSALQQELRIKVEEQSGCSPNPSSKHSEQASSTDFMSAQIQQRTPHLVGYPLPVGSKFL